MFICDNISTNDAGHLTFAGKDVTKLAKKYGTPLYLMDEGKVREKCRIYKQALKKYFGQDGGVIYASKACCFKEMYRIMATEGVDIDVVSVGEIHTAAAAGYDMSHAHFHGSSKTDADIAYAMDKGVGSFVLDNLEEIEAVEREAKKRGIVQNCLFRVTPGIDTHTYAAVNTGKIDSKFGFAIETGQAERALVKILACKHIKLEGYHCHVGSQVFSENVFERSAMVMLEFMNAMYDKYGYEGEILDLGGGYGVPYLKTDARIDIDVKIRDVAEAIRLTCKKLHMNIPYIMFEPGRSIVADAGMTIYTAGTLKEIPGYKNYVSVDGGMTDNPRHALYGSQYTCYNASRINEKHDMLCDLVGKCCESDDIIMDTTRMPAGTKRGDIIAVCTTGAYNYSMASHYNRIPKPAVVMIKGAKTREVVRRETLDDLMAFDV